MSDSRYIIPTPVNEPVKSYAPGSTERSEILKAIEELKSKESDIPMIINGQEIRTENKKRIHPPHDINYTLGYYHQGGKKEVEMAIEAALKAKKSWMELDWGERASIFLKAADMLAGPYRAKMNAATMLGQSKNVHQAEIDAACELIDFYRFNVKYLEQIYEMQPNSAPQQWNSTEWRPLEGFIFALTPFNFTSIAGNLQTSPAMMGNTIVWKPSKTQIYSAAVIMEVLIEAGLPNGVINMVFAPGPVTADTVLDHPDFAGIHFTGSTGVFQSIWEKIGKNIKKYKSYPRIVGETGGKDFVFVHESANMKQVITALTRGAFEYQGQKCSAASRAYIPKSKWPEIKAGLERDLKSIKMGTPEDFTNFVNAVIDEGAFNTLSGAIEKIKAAPDAEIVIGGNYDNSKGYFIEPTVALTSNPMFFSMEEELFGPILTVYLYDEDKYEETLHLCDKTSIYALTGAIFAKDRVAVVKADKILRFAAGNFYINDKPTGAVVGQQPFGGARGSGTNDKAGSLINLMRWVSPRTIKENFDPPTDYRYPFLLDK
ncbi:MAG: L-glutamate gamma-semialdehyde dehydrogenase [Bacteroidales bacterium]|nr:L-glutamate gamma-semialdehyde dehydrogenase [Bacteroidales bacterium]MBN2818493.1 L-glutamate gamma-semialdehyde dehydrogenase [Bacteroidales bacterium]